MARSSRPAIPRCSAYNRSLGGLAQTAGAYHRNGRRMAAPADFRRRIVPDEKELRKSAQRIGSLVQELETIADPAARARSKELVQLLLDLHGAALERMMDIVFRSGDLGTRAIDEF